MAEGKPALIYYGEIKVENGKYQKDGKERTRYHSIGKIFHSPHLSRMTIYLYPTATTEGKWVNAYPHDEYEKPAEKKDIVAEVNEVFPGAEEVIPF